jgi:hypothetical protein
MGDEDRVPVLHQATKDVLKAVSARTQDPDEIVNVLAAALAIASRRYGIALAESLACVQAHAQRMDEPAAAN